MSESNASKITGYRPPVLRENPTSCYVEYYVEHPVTHKMMRQRIKLNHVEGKTRRKQYAQRLMRDLSEKLVNGWNPYKEQESPLGYYTMRKCIETFMANKKDLREDSLRSFRSFSGFLTAWLDANGRLDDYAVNFSVQDASSLMNNLLLTKEIGAKTYNNYLSFFRNFSNWMVGNGYFKANPFSGIKKKREDQAMKEYIPTDIRRKIEPWFRETYPAMFWVAQLQFYCMIRPFEALHLTPAHFDFESQTIQLQATQTKAHRADVVTIPNDFIQECFDFVMNSNARANEYIISTGMKPGKKLLTSRVFSKRWDRVRKKFDLPMEMQFYSYKNSGIISMLEQGMSPDIVMKQARHTKLEQTSVYIRLVRRDADEQIKKFKDV